MGPQKPHELLKKTKTRSLLSPGGLLGVAVLGVSNSSSSAANWNPNEGVV